MLAYAFFHGPAPPPGLAGRAVRAGLAPGPLADAGTEALEFVSGGAAVGVAGSARDSAVWVRDPTSQAVLVGSIRLDDPGALRRALGARADAGDAALVLRAYLAWGDRCAERLGGDFAFAVWDAPARRLFAARDRFGVRPLYYAAARGRVAVAARPGPVLGALGMDRTPDAWRVAELVTGRTLDPTRSFFDGVGRLPAGDLLLANDDGAAARPYWRPDRGRSDSPLSPAQAADAFRSAFDDAVRQRLPDDGRVGAALSGGLDSSSIVATARELREGSPPLPTFTAAFPGLDGADERPYSLAVEQAGGVVSHVVFPAENHPVAEWEADALGVDEPLYLPTWPMERATLAAVRDAGLGVYLVGHGGDHVLSAGPEGTFPDLLRAGRWGRLWREARALGPRRQAGQLVWELAAKDVLRHAVRPALPARVRDGRRPPPALIAPDLARQLRFADQAEALAPPLRTAVDRHAAFLHHPPTHEGLERMAHVSAAFGVELRLPFWDRALVDLCFRVRRDALYRDGVGRRLLREGLAGRLPDAVRSRRSKATFDPLLNGALRRHALGGIREMVAAPGGLGDWVDLPALGSALSRFSTGVDRREAGSSDAQILLRAFTLWQWLHRI